jgi:hypothetical protein
VSTPSPRIRKHTKASKAGRAGWRW